ncbi:MAG: hypothetical protein A2571_02220 [Candidatus Vogelbacteria bacterium RIFOXYD1_FULL_44_32]|uniref:MurNAc-LAA domain-containing protein n=1 Tax=Candidatus Vogelbacteria bacterium RIFOXYD1_FULL_44_32 TaxID=1802438 RepID=A0A1G2QDT5_9BACT|nr:MAG: hypothetical protein A2571_02220 [Candidatus Vogelbacteria bacterium RIFOXYD1_FULL_44_32]
MFGYFATAGKILATTVVVFLVALAWQPRELPDTAEIKLASTNTVPVVAEKVSSEYSVLVEPITILLVPGHDLYSSGAEFKGVKEETLTRQLAEKIDDLLTTDGRFQVIRVRDYNSGEYTEEFAVYFSGAETQIKRFRQTARETMKNLLGTGKIEKINNGIEHNYARDDVSFRLYGLNKWGNDHEVDLSLHLHFNDYPRKNLGSPGKYKGFAMYIPERQLANGATSRALAEDIYDRLQWVSATSTFPLEAETIIETQDLIATGSYNSQTQPAMLVEYGYIYEPRIYLDNKRMQTLDVLAEATYRGIVRYFFGR